MIIPDVRCAGCGIFSTEKRKQMKLSGFGSSVQAQTVLSKYNAVTFGHNHGAAKIVKGVSRGFDLPVDSFLSVLI